MSDLKVGDRVWIIEEEILKEYIVIREANTGGFVYVIEVNNPFLSSVQEDIIAYREHSNVFKKTKVECVNSLVDKLRKLIDE